MTEYSSAFFYWMLYKGIKDFKLGVRQDGFGIAGGIADIQTSSLMAIAQCF